MLRGIDALFSKSSLKGSPATAATMAPKKKIAVMTSGGDSPGMNGVVRAVVRMAIHLGCDPFAIYEGYEGLVRGGDFIKRMEWHDVRGWLSEGGTLIGTARCMAFYERPGRLTAAKNMVLNGIDALIICGGDGSLTGADKFRSEWPSLLEELASNGELTADQIAPYKHLNIVGIVGSIDNDLSGTDATVGCYSALSRICEMVDYIEATASSHSRAFVIEVMGRHCGWLALLAGVATGADFVFIPEHPQEHEWRDDMCEVVNRHRGLGKRKTIVIVAEGARDKNGTKISSEEIKELLSDKKEGGLGLDTRITTLGHVQRGGTAVAYDRVLATLQGVEAVKAVLEATPETETCVIAMNENQIVRKPLMKAVQETQEVAHAVESKDFQKAMSLRDTEFADQYKSYLFTTNVMVDYYKLPQKNVGGSQINLISVCCTPLDTNIGTAAHEDWLYQRGRPSGRYERGGARRCGVLHWPWPRAHRNSQWFCGVCSTPR